jgi:effector-binding domain-containing protein
MEYAVTLEQRPEQPAAVVRGHVTVEELPAFLGGAFGEVAAALGAQHLVPAGPPFGRYRLVDGGFDVEAGFPSSGPVSAAGRVEPAELPGGPVATTMHVGSYDDVGAAYQAVTDWVEAAGYVVVGDPWECYLDGPEVPEPRTTVCFPCREA